jgi:hypothetical protein
MRWPENAAPGDVRRPLVRLAETLDGARCVVFDRDRLLLGVWFGSSTGSVYGLDGTAVDAFTLYCGDCGGSGARRHRLHSDDDRHTWCAGCDGTGRPDAQAMQAALLEHLAGTEEEE